MADVDWAALWSGFWNAIPWAAVATWLGIGANLFWNWRNHRRANKVRADGIKLDEFKRLRTQADLALGGLRTIRGKLRSLEASGQSRKQLREEISGLNKEASASCGELQLALSDMDQSKFADGADWLASISDPLDALFDAFDRTYSPLKNEMQILQSVATIVQCIDTLCANVRTRLDQELAKYAR